MGKYQRISNRASYSKESFKEAVKAVENGMSGYQASKIYNIPRMTIMDHVKKRRTKSTTLGRNTALPSEIELKLATNLHLMEKYGFGLSRTEVIQMIGDYINQNDLITPFRNGLPGKDWFLAFKKRHGLSLKKPQAVEYARKRAMDPFLMYPYFDLLEKTINDLNLQDKPSCIWNLDETSFSRDPAKTKIVGAKGHVATRVISSAGRDNTTVLLGISASGEKTPPLIVYKGKNVWDTWTSSDAYPGTSYAATSNGWMETEVFESFFKKTFLVTVQDRRPVLLIYDGHSTHVGLNIIEEARKENITILKLPAHSSHILQPLDIAVMKAFKDRWDASLVQWQRLNIGSIMPKSEFAKLIGQIWAGLDPQVLRNGFRKAGIYPVNRKEIKESQFDSLKLRHWREYESKQNRTTRNNPKTLFTIALDSIHQMDMSKNHEVMKEVNPSNVLLESPAGNHHITFEELLLQKVSRGDSSPKPRRQKVAPGAVVITHNDVLEKKQQEQRKPVKTYINKNQMKAKDAHSQLASNTNDNVVYLSNLSRNDSQLKAFSVKDINDLPSCLQTQKSRSPKIKVISNVLIKKPHTEKTNNGPDIKSQKYCEAAKLAKSHKGYQVSRDRVSLRESAINQIDKKVKNITIVKHNTKRSCVQTAKDLDAKNLTRNNPKPGPSGLCKAKYRRRSDSTTSVSGSISSHSDSDIMNIVSDSTTIIDEDETNNYDQASTKLNTVRQTSFKYSENDFTSDEDKENFQVTMYSPGDDVLVRYHIRQKWSYYLGRIENIKITDDDLYYSIIFYKTIKKPELTFKMTKKIDRDDVPVTLLVKKVNLIQDPVTLNYFFDRSDDNSVYFS